MKKQIVFKCDEAFRIKLRDDKNNKEKKLKNILNWEEYFNLLFYGDKKFPMENIGRKGGFGINYKGGRK